MTFEEKKIIFSENLNRLMKENGIRSVDLVNLLGVTKSAISNYRHALSMGTDETRSAIANFFQISKDDLFIKPGQLSDPGGNNPCAFFVHVLCNTLISTENLGRRDNFCGIISLPFPPVPGVTTNLYAVRIMDDLLKKSGYPIGRIVYFSPDIMPEENDISVVAINKVVHVHRVAFEKDKIILSTDKRKKEEFFYQGDKDGDVVVLGKILM